MPVEFLSSDQRNRYGSFQGAPTSEQLAAYFHWDDRDREIINRHRGKHNRLGFALQLGTVRFLGTFLTNPIEVPIPAVHYVAAQLEIADANCLKHYCKRQTWWDHVSEICQFEGYFSFWTQPAHWRFTRWLYSRSWLSDESVHVLFDQATIYLVEHKILLPGVTVLERTIATIRERVQERIWQRVARLPSSQQRQQLIGLLTVDTQTQRTPLEQLRRSPTRYTSSALVEALHRLVQVQQWQIRQLDFSKIPPSRIQGLARPAFTYRAQSLARLPQHRQIATLVAFAYVLEATAQDDVLDILELRVKELLAKSEREGKQQRLRTLKDLDQAALQLSQAVRVLLDEQCPNDQVRTTVFEQTTPAQLAQAVTQVETLARPPEDAYYPEVLTRWSQVRQFLPLLLRTIKFESNKAGQPILVAWRFLGAIEGTREPDMQSAPLTIVTKGWSHWVVLANGRIDRRAYTFCVLEQLLGGLSRRDLFVTPTERWSHPRAKLLRGEKWESLRGQVCRLLNVQSTAAPELEQLKQQLHDAYERTLENWNTNSRVRLEVERGREILILSPLDQLEESDSLRLLKRQVATLLPQVDLPEVLLEINAKTGFIDAFRNLNGQPAQVADFATSLCAVLIASACNVGMRPLIRSGYATLSRDRLDWVKHNFVRNDTLTAANARLVEAQQQISLAHAWGGGDVASADGLRFVVPVRSLHAGPNQKYFGRGRGITYYNFISDQFTGFHAVVVPGTLRDSLVVLTGLLEQRTSLQPQEIMTDTAGYSDVIFGLFWLLGYQFSPRLADLGSARFWRLDPEADYGVLDQLSKRRVNTKLIEEHWDDMLRVAGSLKLGSVSALEIMRALHRGQNPSTLAKAIGELGRVAKTLHLLNYVDDEAFRRRILLQLNRGEGRHSLARVVFHGRKGEVRQPYREGQENQLSTLGLVVNAIILWNTFYMDAALTHLRQQGIETKEEDIARLSPLRHRHINMLGRYYVELPERLQQGEMRPLRDLSNIEALEEWED